jgi:hypothetical protein
MPVCCGIDGTLQREIASSATSQLNHVPGTRLANLFTERSGWTVHF